MHDIIKENNAMRKISEEKQISNMWVLAEWSSFSKELILEMNLEG